MPQRPVDEQDGYQCVGCKESLALEIDHEWPECGPICYGCLADRLSTAEKDRDEAKHRLEGVRKQRDKANEKTGEWERTAARVLALLNEKHAENHVIVTALFDAMRHLETEYMAEQVLAMEAKRRSAVQAAYERMKAVTAEHAHHPTQTPLTIDYTNHRGDRAVRKILPMLLRFGTERPWHRTPTWLVDAIDVDKGEARTFDVRSIHSLNADSPALTVIETRLLEPLKELARLAIYMHHDSPFEDAEERLERAAAEHIETIGEYVCSNEQWARDEETARRQEEDVQTDTLAGHEGVRSDTGAGL